jgi:hypothetical protein
MHERLAITFPPWLQSTRQAIHLGPHGQASETLHSGYVPTTPCTWFLPNSALCLLLTCTLFCFYCVLNARLLGKQTPPSRDGQNARHGSTFSHNELTQLEQTTPLSALDHTGQTMTGANRLPEARAAATETVCVPWARCQWHVEIAFDNRSRHISQTAQTLLGTLAYLQQLLCPVLAE